MGLDELLAMDRADDRNGAAFSGVFGPGLLNQWGGVQGGILMALTVKALCDTCRGSPHPDVRHYHVTFYSAPKGGSSFVIEVRKLHQTRNFTFLEGEMLENADGNVPYLRFQAVACDFSLATSLDVLPSPTGPPVKAQRTSDWLNPFSTATIGSLKDLTRIEDFSALPSFWDSISFARHVFAATPIFEQLLDLRLYPDSAAAIAAGVARKPPVGGVSPASASFDQPVSFFAGSPDRRPVDPIFLALLSETPACINALLPPRQIVTRNITVSVLSFTLDFFARVPSRDFLLVRNFHQGYCGDVGMPETTVWDQETGRLIMTGRGVALMRNLDRGKI
ncbi:hypothetical protein DFJ74DRAFT_663608 [Hyaloraphidium curvatum]|nr:hypothetical protein DFJ74DRAFT_663608 [Hyaloraphidium curvatum]